MAREPQRSEQPRPLGAAIMPVQRALIARAKEIEKDDLIISANMPAEVVAAVRVILAAEFRALAEELGHW